MGALLKEESTITAKGQTTVPKSVRQALGVDYGGRIAFLIDEQHRVYVQKAEIEETADPVIDRFLEFLARDMAKHPEKSVLPFPQSLLDRAVALTAGMTVDLDAEIEGTFLSDMPTINGWTVLSHPLFLDQWEKLIEAVDTLKAKKPDDYQKSADAKLLASLVQLVTVNVPSDPTASIYRQGATLGDDRKHWFRAKFGNGRFRLFFRYSSTSKVIIFAWVNDENSLRTYGSKTDAYKVFKGMLDDGNPPDDWDTLHKEASDPKAVARLEKPRPRIHDEWR